MNRAQRIAAHYTAAWGSEISRMRWTRGPVHELPEDFHVGVWARSDETIAYGTIGMSQAAEAPALELFMLTSRGPPDWDIVEILTVSAHFHRTGAPLALGHTVNLGQSIKPSSPLTHALISLPYLDGPSLEVLESDGTRFLWLLPITLQEREFKRTYGVDRLEARFEAARFNYLDLQRASVV